jgi:predicted nucleic acid-binding protein
MTTSVDTNVIVALWHQDLTVSASAQRALDSALGQGSLVLSAPVFAELMAAPGRTEAFLDKFCFRDRHENRVRSE